MRRIWDKIGIMRKIPKIEHHWSGSTLKFAKCDICGSEIGATDEKLLMVGSECSICKSELENSFPKAIRKKVQKKMRKLLSTSGIIDVNTETGVWD